MKVLFGKTFGLGNSVMSIPTVKALKSMGHDVDLLLGTLHDDAGSIDVFTHLKNNFGLIDKIHLDNAMGPEYDVAIMSTPFDGRWRNGVSFNAKKVMDCRPRPDPATTGFISWKKHEVEYQMDNARELGYVGETPSMQFMKPAQRFNRIFFGVGHKKNAAKAFVVRQWGTDNFISLGKMLLAADPTLTIMATGDGEDVTNSLAPIAAALPRGKFLYDSLPIGKACEIVNTCKYYIGNDTGMTHVAASCNLLTLSLQFEENAVVKNPPFCPNGHSINGFPDRDAVTPDLVFKRFQELK